MILLLPLVLSALSFLAVSSVASDAGLNVRNGFVRRNVDASSADVHLFDTVILASIDGKLHGLNRTNGRVKWSMQSPQSSISSGASSRQSQSKVDEPPLHSLVRSIHHEFSSDGSMSELEETYIIEPQSGEIFVLPPGASRNTPLEKLPLTIPQLVEMSPFRLSVHNEQRTFLGRKDTSFITLDLDTGAIVSIDDADSCIWRESSSTSDTSEYDADPRNDWYDDNDAPIRTPRREIVIGKTDYHLTIRTDPRKEVLQTLKFSVYGPNSLDHDLQKEWHRPLDGRYLQPLPDGRVFSFKPRAEEFHSFEWLVPFPKPAVAIFDVVSRPGELSPLILNQPKPTLQALFPGRHFAKELSELEERTYVGVIGDSLFAMSSNNFPLVSVDYRFSSSSSEAESSSTDLEIPLLERECTAQGCLVGNHASGDSASSRFSRLIEATNPPRLMIEAPAPVPHPSSPSTAPTPSSSRGLNAGTTQGHSPYFYHDPPSPPGFFDTYGMQSLVMMLCATAAYLVYFLRQKQFLPPLQITSISSVEGSPTISDDMAAPQPPVTTEPTSIPKPSSSKITFAEPTPLPPKTANDEDGSDGEDGVDGEGEDGLKRKKRRRRGRKKPKGSEAADGDEAEPLPVPNPDPGSSGDKDKDYVIVPPTAAQPSPPVSAAPIVHVVSTPPVVAAPSLVVSDTVLGYGSAGTVVYKGSFQGRAVAVKRLLQDFVTLASREVSLLQETDSHPNVIRYYYQESSSSFLYIALELCPASLEDLIARPNNPAWRQIAIDFEPKRALSQIVRGMRHLHGLGIVHRDIKPQNILVSQSRDGKLRMLISDFGLCKKLGHDETSFLPTHAGPMGAGTVGWRAPEILNGEVRLDISEVESGSSGSVGGNDSTIGSIGSTGTVREKGKDPRRRLTKFVDIFALGCLFFYTLTGGEHPYGGPFEREANIVRDRKDLSWLEKLGEEGEEAKDLITRMLDADPRARPDTSACLIHPFFWNPSQRLGFLQDASDRFEIMERDPPEKGLVALETGAFDVVGADWQRRLDRVFLDNLGKFRKYNGRSVQDLMRALRNKKHHYQDLPDNVKRHLGPLPEGYLAYFTTRFPKLFLHVYYVVANSPQLRTETMFKTYFDVHYLDV